MHERWTLQVEVISSGLLKTGTQGEWMCDWNGSETANIYIILHNEIVYKISCETQLEKPVKLCC